MLDVAGAVLFAGALGSLDAARRRNLLWLAAAGAALTVVQHVLMTARLAASFDGIVDWSLQAFYLGSDAGAAHGIRLVGLLAILAGGYRRVYLPAAAGAVAVCLSFAAMGHTATHSLRWLLATCLAVHVLMIAFWFGSLRPLRSAAVPDPRSVAELLERFSRIAVVAVPVLFVAGIGLAVVLLGSFQALATPYGAMIVAKLTGFALLVGLASLNRWRLLPRIRSGEQAAIGVFRHVAAVEWLLIALVIATTVVMTSLFSPHP